jgi:hypothetical protein
MTNSTPLGNSPVWTAFTYINFGVATLMMGGGIWFMDATFTAKGFYAMAALMLVSSTIILTKSLRDNEESQRFHNKLEDARTEKLLMEANNSGK